MGGGLMAEVGTVRGIATEPLMAERSSSRWRSDYFSWGPGRWARQKRYRPCLLLLPRLAANST
jgi:hypothetical protein